MERIKEHLLKIYRLAQHGVGGEKENANRILERTLRKHNLTLEDLLQQETVTEKWFDFKSNAQRDLIIQIIGTVCQESKVAYMQGRHTLAHKVGFRLTNIQIVMADMLVAAYVSALANEERKQRKQHAKERKHLLVAFLAKHNLLSKAGPGEKDSLMDYDIDEILRQARRMDSVTVRQQLPGYMLEEK